MGCNQEHIKSWFHVSELFKDLKTNLIKTPLLVKDNFCWIRIVLCDKT